MGFHDRDYSKTQRSSFGPISITYWIIGINVVIFFLDQALLGSPNGNLAPYTWFAFRVDRAVFGLQFWRWIGYQFEHASPSHLIFNMLGLYMFGPLVEQWWGSARYLAFYLLCGIAGAALFTLLAFLSPGPSGFMAFRSLVGASGSILGIIAAAAILFPKMTVMLLFPPIPMTMRTMALIFIGIAVFTVVSHPANAGGDAAHLGGAALGWLLVKKPWLLNWVGGISLPRPKPAATRPAPWVNDRPDPDDQAEVDRILDKVRAEGLNSLTQAEKTTLRQATERRR